LKQQTNVYLNNGCLIDDCFIQQTAKEIVDEMLADSGGVLSIEKLAKKFDVSLEFVRFVS
jgi:hypothetical protein